MKENQGKRKGAGIGRRRIGEKEEGEELTVDSCISHSLETFSSEYPSK